MQRKVAKLQSSKEKLISDKYTQMSQEMIQSVCKYYNTGFCKFKGEYNS